MNDIEKLNEKFEKASPQEILAWAIKTYPKAGLSSSFGGESAGLIHMVTRIKPDIPILLIDTGFLFKQTLDFAESLRKKFNLNLKIFKATPEQIAVTTKNLEDPKNRESASCCEDSKIALMQKSLEGLDCWIAGLRRNQTKTRKNIKIIENYRSGLVKVHPLANWTSKEIYGYMTENNLPFHPLWEKGFTSVGCEPCTRPPMAGGDERSGRWAGQEKKECGIHTFLEKDKT